MSQNFEGFDAASPVVSDASGPIESRRPVVLALWASLRMAEELADFCCSGFETMNRFEFEVWPAKEIGKLNRNGASSNRFSAILLAYAEDDEQAPDVAKYVREWAREKSDRGEKPMVICREGLLPSVGASQSANFWNGMVDELRNEFSADIIRDSRELYSGMQSTVAE